jgi:hypothetical protein
MATVDVLHTEGPLLLQLQPRTVELHAAAYGSAAAIGAALSRFLPAAGGAAEPKVRASQMVKSWLAFDANFIIPFLTRSAQGAGAEVKAPLVTHDGRTIRYPQPDIYVNDTAKVDIESGRIVDSFKFEVGQVVMITGGHNVGRVGQLIQREKHIGSYEIAHIKDTAGKTFSTRASNVFIIGEGNKASITLPKGKGIKLTILEEAAMRS